MSSASADLLHGPHWPAAGRDLLSRMIAELAYEELLKPSADGERWRIELPEGVEYTFAAERGTFGTWRVAPASITRTPTAPPDPVRFARDVAPAVGWSGPVMAELIRDLIATQVADVRLRSRAVTAAELADLSHEDIEAHQTGHPCLILNKGRLGFSAADAARYTPEAARRVPRDLDRGRPDARPGPWTAAGRPARAGARRGDQGGVRGAHPRRRR